MADFTLDTSGAVLIVHEGAAGSWGFDMLDPFTQGYVEALFASACAGFEKAGFFMPYANQPTPGMTSTKAVGFSDLAPETLAAILRDCGELHAFFAGGGHREPTYQDGKTFWELRQAGQLPPDPPLIVTLGDDGKVYLRESAP